MVPKTLVSNCALKSSYLHLCQKVIFEPRRHGEKHSLQVFPIAYRNVSCIVDQDIDSTMKVDGFRNRLVDTLLIVGDVEL